MIYGHDEGKNAVQLCDGENEAVRVEMGGTGGKTAEKARENLGLGKVSTEDVVPVEMGGTGAETAAEAREKLGINNITAQQKVFEYNFQNAYIMVNSAGVKRLVLDVANRTFTAGTAITLGTLPEAYRPSVYKVYHVFVMNASASSQLYGRITIDTEGLTTFCSYAARNAGDDIHLDLTYI